MVAFVNRMARIGLAFVQSDFLAQTVEHCRLTLALMQMRVKIMEYADQHQTSKVLIVSNQLIRSKFLLISLLFFRLSMHMCRRLDRLAWINLIRVVSF